MQVAHILPSAIVSTTLIFLTSCSPGSGSGGTVVVLGPETQLGISGLVENHEGLSNNAQAVLFDDGSAMAVWYGSETLQDPPRVFASRFTPGGDWSNPEAIDAASGDPYPPRLAANENGDVVAVWTALDTNGVDQRIYANTYRAGVGWGAAQALQAPGMQEQPKVAMNEAGTALAVWREMDASGIKSIVSSRFTAAAGWEPPFTIGEVDDLLTLPDVGIDAAGNGIAAWLNRSPSGNKDLVSSRFVDGVGWSMTDVVESLDGAASVYAIALNAAGSGQATWWQSDGGTHALYASRFDPDSGWSAAEEIGLSAGTPGWLSLALGSDGNAMVLWEQDAAGSQDIYAAHRRPDGVWGDPQLLDSLEGTATQPQVAIDADGDAVAVWLQQDGQTDSLYGARFNLQNGWGPQLILEGTNGPPARWWEVRSPAVVMNPSGDALIVWTQFDGDIYSIYASSFDRSN